MVKPPQDVLATEMEYSRLMKFAFPLRQLSGGRFGFHHFITPAPTEALSRGNLEGEHQLTDDLSLRPW
jgi:hypothetical protein